MKETHLKYGGKGNICPQSLAVCNVAIEDAQKGRKFCTLEFPGRSCFLSSYAGVLLGTKRRSTDKTLWGCLGETALSRQVPAVLWEPRVSTGQVTRSSLLCSCAVKAAELLQQDTGGFQLCSLWRAGISHAFLYYKAKRCGGRWIWGFGRTGSIFESWGCFLTGKHSL